MRRSDSYIGGSTVIVVPVNLRFKKSKRQRQMAKERHKLAKHLRGVREAEMATYLTSDCVLIKRENADG